LQPCNLTAGKEIFLTGSPAFEEVNNTLLRDKTTPSKELTLKIAGSEIISMPVYPVIAKGIY